MLNAERIRAIALRNEACSDAVEWLETLRPNTRADDVFWTCPSGNWIAWFLYKCGLDCDRFAPAAYAAGDRCFRVYAPSILRRLGYDDHAKTLEKLRPIADLETIREAMAAKDLIGLAIQTDGQRDNPLVCEIRCRLTYASYGLENRRYHDAMDSAEIFAASAAGAAGYPERCEREAVRAANDLRTWFTNNDVERLAERIPA